MNTGIESIREAYAGSEHWILVCDQESRGLLDVIRRRYYQGAEGADLGTVEAGAFTIAAARKRRMMNYQLVSLLRQCTPLRLRERDLARDVIVCTKPANLLPGTLCAAELFQGRE